eukprot:TRINITY_DN2105_c0_g1_i4.p1 TRINITY_DN2105_c0_g1~~TRINITY_DN2105_c0_g1_i4.p1  ORF type:complete len:594 (+),score=75.62 TRINITY_DN2105_c0_g1_i4:119-1900(+)
MIRRPPRSTLSSSSAASDVYKRQALSWPTDDAALMLLCTGSDPLECQPQGKVPCTVSKAEWATDDSSDCCTGCHARFSFLLRRHHCRLCGGLFCNTCSSKSMYASIRGSPGKRDQVRACNRCQQRGCSTPLVQDTPAMDAAGQNSTAIATPPMATAHSLDLGEFSLGALGFTAASSELTNQRLTEPRTSDLMQLRANLREAKMLNSSSSSVGSGREPSWLPEAGHDCSLPSEGSGQHCNLPFKMGLDKLKEICALGAGNYGTVIKVQSKKTGDYYALKVLERDANQTAALQSMVSEKTLLEAVSHPHIVKLEFSFSTDRRYYLGLEYCPGGDLASQLDLEADNCFDELRSSIYTAQIACALLHLHSQQCIFRDLKPDNVLINREGHATLTDFGLCKVMVAMTDGGRAKTFCGSPGYMAPEMLAKHGYSFQVDWWGLGVLLHEMLFGMPPFYHRDVSIMWHQIKHARLDLQSSKEKTLSHQASSALHQLLDKDPASRLGANGGMEVQGHRFFSWCKSWDPTPSPVHLTKPNAVIIPPGLESVVAMDLSSSAGARANRLNMRSRSFEDETSMQDDRFYFVREQVFAAETEVIEYM